MGTKVAVITGITGQDGAYLAEFLLKQHYRVIGIVRRSSHSGTTHRLRRLNIEEAIEYIDGDVLDVSSLCRIFRTIQPSEVYNFAAQSFVKTSWQQPLLTAQVTGIGAANVLEALRLEIPTARFYQASSSEMYGLAPVSPQNEHTPFHPRSPYAAAKLFAHCMTVNYRESYGIFACAGILFNHESLLRGHEFVTRKVTDGVARISLGMATELRMGNLDAQRDWGHARDYVEGIWGMLQQDEPDDYVLATGEAHSVREFVELALAHIGRPIEWRGEGVDECGIDLRTGDVLVRVDPQYLRPAEVHRLLGDPSKARQRLGWQHRTTFRELVCEMVDSDIAILAAGGLKLPRYG
jgi:GDPmannose 4,6-dehydratase